MRSLRPLLCATLLLVFHVAFGDCDRAESHVGPNGPALRLLPIAARLLQDGTLPGKAARALGGALAPTEASGSWTVSPTPPGISIILGGTRLDASLTDIRLIFSDEIDVKMANLSEIFGPHHVVAESKTSTVRFSPPGTPSVVVFARLPGPRVTPQAAVASVTVSDRRVARQAVRPVRAR
jgi:hypothetical protein